MKKRYLYSSNVPLQSEGQVFGCDSAAVCSDGICPVVRDTLFPYGYTLFGTKSMYRTLLLWKTFDERAIFEQRRMQHLTTFL